MRVKTNRQTAWATVSIIGMLAAVACTPISPSPSPFPSTLPPFGSASQSSITPENVPSASLSSVSTEEVLNRGEAVSFVICRQSDNWGRPSEQEQTEVWQEPRYGFDPNNLPKNIEYDWTHDFLMYYGGGESVEYDMVHMTGIWSATDARWLCDNQWRKSVLHNVAAEDEEIWAEVWVLLHRVVEIKRLDRYYVIIVQPEQRGFQWVDFPRPPGPGGLTLSFVTSKGDEIETIVEGQTPGTWPIERKTW